MCSSDLLKLAINNLAARYTGRSNALACFLQSLQCNAPLRTAASKFTVFCFVHFVYLSCLIPFRPSHALQSQSEEKVCLCLRLGYVQSQTKFPNMRVCAW